MISDKTVLLMCHETDTVAFYHLASILLQMGNRVKVLFVSHLEAYLNPCELNRYTYYKMIELLGLENVYSYNELAEEWKNHFKNPFIDFNYLREIEKQFCHYKNLNLQIMSSQNTTKYYHTRFYFNKTTDDQNNYYLELNYKYTLKNLDVIQPDVILDVADNTLGRTIVNEIAYNREIPYITFNYPRIENWQIPTFSLGNVIDEYFITLYHKKLKSPKTQLKDGYEYVETVRKKNSIMPERFKGTETAKYEGDSVYKILKKIYGYFIYSWQEYYNNKKKLVDFKHGIHMGNNSFKHFLFRLKCEIKRQILFRKNRYFDLPKDEDYVYMPLHLIPESTTFVKAPYYVNELEIIEQISKSLPIGWKLYVKEHQSMLGERSFKFYKRISELPNVKMVQFNYYKDPKPWIEHAKGVVTITGTTALEAAMLGKRAIILGIVPFAMIDGIKQIKSYDELPLALSQLGEPIDNRHSCAAYVEAVFDAGVDINYRFLREKGMEFIKKNMSVTEEYQTELEKLLFFYHKSLELYKGQNN